MKRLYVHVQGASRGTWQAQRAFEGACPGIRLVEWDHPTGPLIQRASLDNSIRSNLSTSQELIDWITANESTVNVEPSTVEIRGIPATKLDFDLSQGMLYIRTPGSDATNVIHHFEQENEVAIYVLDVNGAAVSIVVEAEPPIDLATLEQMAQPVLDSIVWRDL